VKNKLPSQPIDPTPFDGVAAYHTAHGRKPPLRVRLCPWKSLAFHLRIIQVVRRSSRKARAGRLNGRAWVAASLAVLRYLEDAGVQLTVEGLDRLDALQGPAVYVGNHMSTLETFLLPSILRPRGPVTFVVKQSLLDYPVFGPVMRSRDPIAVGRANPREDLVTVMEEGKERLGRGVSVIVFPQTTRTHSFDAAKFNSIGAKLAARAGVPLVPLALKTDAWGTHRWLKDIGPIRPELPVRLRFGEPILPEGKGDAAHRAAVAFITETLKEWGVEVRSA
jgi:1-acyl-sn-glycerol-3-phosphate acyltransferase